MVTKVINFYYTYKRKIIILASCLLVLLLGLFSFYLINNEYKTEEKEIKIEEVVKESKQEEENVDTKIFVDIKGEVVNPGVYELELGSKVIDAINASGGLTESAYTRYLNLSKKLKDEDVIIVNNLSEIESIKESKNKEVIKETSNSVSLDINDVITNDYESEEDNSDKTIVLVNINTANVEELTTINGIGESTAKKIIDYREKNGIFESIEDIQNVSGIGEKKYEQIKESITIK